jgi:hypothetical protein
MRADHRRLQGGGHAAGHPVSRPTLDIVCPLEIAAARDSGVRRGRPATGSCRRRPPSRSDRSHTLLLGRHVATPRAVAMYISRHHTKDSDPDLASAFGGKHHTTVISAVRTALGLVAATHQPRRRDARRSRLCRRSRGGERGDRGSRTGHCNLLHGYLREHRRLVVARFRREQQD